MYSTKIIESGKKNILRTSSIRFIFNFRKHGKTVNEIVMKTMDRQLQTLENEMGRLKRRRAKLISLLDPPIPHLEPVKTSRGVSGNVQDSVQSRVSVGTPNSSEKFLPKLKEEPSSPIFYIGNNHSDDDVTYWRDYVDDVEIPQVSFFCDLKTLIKILRVLKVQLLR